jgi:FKBP-type peptidyl-prolyl cis-trans isomerase SlyD
MIEKNKVVTLNYKLTEAGKSEEIESTYGGQPLMFIFETGTMLPKFEENLKNLNQGDKFNFVLKAADAYGEVIESAITEIPKTAFAQDGKIDEDIIQLGKVLPMQDKDGNRFDGIIVEINDDSIKMDFNHPLAGFDLNFEGEITEVRDATELELEHGHVHADGHDHH